MFSILYKDLDEQKCQTREQYLWFEHTELLSRMYLSLKFMYFLYSSNDI